MFTNIFHIIYGIIYYIYNTNTIVHEKKNLKKHEFKRPSSSSIFIIVISKLLTSKMLLFISAGTRFTKKRSNLIFATLLRTSVNERIKNFFSSIAVLISIGVVVGWKLRKSILNDLFYFNWYVWYSASVSLISVQLLYMRRDY